MAERTSLTILIIDDEEANRYALRRILEKSGFVVLEAATGAAGLRILSETRPDLVILDVKLPDMNGFEVCQKIKADPINSLIPVPQASASFVESEKRAEGLESGADAYVTHPISARELVANVRALLRIRQAEQAAREQRELLRVTLDSIGDGVIAADPLGRVTFINPVAGALTGWTQEEGAEQLLDRVYRVVDETSGEPVEGPLARVLRGAPGSDGNRPLLLVARDGTPRPVGQMAAPIHDDKGEFVGVVVVFRDVGERRQMENELRRRADELADRDRRKDEFLAMLAHELRNPLAPIRHAVQLLRTENMADPIVAEVGPIMERQLRNLVRLVDDLMDVSRITQGKIELRKELVELSTAVRRTVEAVRPQIEEKQHRLDVDLPSDPLWLEADPARLDQVLSNLLNNASKYTQPGGQIQLSVTREDNRAVVRVRDNGIGIPEHMQRAIFDMFQQADRVPGRVSEGLGLGLTLVRTLVEMHGGSIEVHSPGRDQGSEFVVRLPILDSRIAQEKQAEALKRKAPLAEPKSLRIMIVDDNTDGARSLALLLRKEGHQIEVAHDGPAALDAAGRFRPEVVLLDIGLPKGMDGYEVARRLRQLPGLKDVMLVALTGFGQEEDRQRSSEAGFQFHLVKPLDPALLRDLLLRTRPGTEEPPS